MHSKLIAYLSRYMPIPQDLAEALGKASFVKSYPKGSFLLREGDPVDTGFFLLSGCVRSYVLKDGDDRTIDFYIEEDPILPLGYGKEGRASHFLECLEDTVAVVSTPEEEERTLREHPELKTVCLAMSEIMAAKLQESLARYKTAKPEERYQDLVSRRPDLLQRIPQYQIASYLGIKPESLSRIRRRLAGRS